MKIFYFGDDPFVKTGFGAVNNRLYSALTEAGHSVAFAGRNTNSKAEHPKRIYQKNKLTEGYYEIKRGSFPGKSLVDVLKNNEFDRYIFHEDIALLSMLFFGTTIDGFIEGISKLLDMKKVMWIGPFDSVIPGPIDKRFIETVGSSFPYTHFGKLALDTTGEFKLGPSIPIPTETIERPEFGNKFLFVGANRYKKKIDMLVDSFSIYKKNINPEAELYIKTEPGNYYNQLFNTEFDGIHVIYSDKGDRETDAKMVELFTKCDTYVSLCTNEGWGLPLTDATHYNMKIIAVDFPVHGESCNNNYTPIPVYDFFDFDGIRTIPVPDYRGAYKYFGKDVGKLNNDKVNYWNESINNFIKHMENL